MLRNKTDTIAAIATAPGRGGVGVVRLSGADLSPFFEGLLGKPLQPRLATFCRFRDAQGGVLDEGIALYFPAPASFTGEHVLELQGHGGPVVMDLLMQRCIELGARAAQPGEFSERAFLNDKLDLAQAEAIADLIDASSQQAARSALRSLQGDFSRRVHGLVEQLIELRIYIEAAIDFPEEEIDFLADERILNSLLALGKALQDTLDKAHQGALLRDGMTVVLAGRPNAGKSSLLNALAGREAAIVTDIAGTTRDILREQISLDGMPLHVVDTAGLRESSDVVEQEGIRRAWAEIETADLILFVVDSAETRQPDLQAIWPEYFTRFPDSTQPVTVVLNKVDSTEVAPGKTDAALPTFAISAKYNLGLEPLIAHLEHSIGYQGEGGGLFSARRRHLESLHRAQALVAQAEMQLTASAAGELVAEDLRQAQYCLGEITGEFTSDDLLGRIFSSFCIGK